MPGWRRFWPFDTEVQLSRRYKLMRCPLDTPTLVHRLRHEKRNGTQQYGVRRGTPGAPFFSLLHALAPRNETNLLVALAGAATWPCAPYHPLACPARSRSGRRAPCRQTPAARGVPGTAQQHTYTHNRKPPSPLPTTARPPPAPGQLPLQRTALPRRPYTDLDPTAQNPVPGTPVPAVFQGGCCCGGPGCARRAPPPLRPAAASVYARSRLPPRVA